LVVFEQKARQTAGPTVNKALQEPVKKKLNKEANGDGADENRGAKDGDADVLPAVGGERQNLRSLVSRLSKKSGSKGGIGSRIPDVT